MIPTPYEIIPHLTVNNAAAAIDFYKNALGFNEVNRMKMPDGRVMHCAMELGNCKLMLNDSFPEMNPDCSRTPKELGGTGVTIHVYVPDVDAAFGKAIAAGAKAIMPVSDMFWGDRYGLLVDPFGHRWSLATHKEAVTPEEAKKRAAAMFAKKG